MKKEIFESLVAKVVGDLPQEFLTRLENVDIVVENRPTYGQVARAGLKYDQTLLGLYDGFSGPRFRRQKK